MPRENSKVSLIHDYLKSNPTATWRVAQADLEQHGISPSYFSIQKSKWKGGGGKKTRSMKKAKGKAKPERAAKAPAGSSDLSSAVDFARSVGGISKAQELLNKLADFQVRGN
jgi:hypothetical protein